MKRAFTFMEILAVVAIVGIIATFAVPGYINMMEKSKARVCETNQRVLLGAVEIYALENDALPASLSKLNTSQIERSWVKVFKQKSDWKTRLAYMLVDFDKRGLAYANVIPTWLAKYLPNRDLACPLVTPGNISYGFNSNLAGMSYTAYKALPGNTDIVGDSTALILNYAERHKHMGVFTADHYGIVAQKSGGYRYPGRIRVPAGLATTSGETLNTTTTQLGDDDASLTEQQRSCIGTCSSTHQSDKNAKEACKAACRAQ